MKKEHTILFMGLVSTLFAGLLLGAFFLGARLGHRIFPEYSQGTFDSAQPKAFKEEGFKKGKPSHVNKLTNNWEEEESDEAYLDQGAPQYRVDENGEPTLAEPAEDLPEEDPLQEDWAQAEDYGKAAPAKERPIDTTTFVRYKASGHSRFAVQFNEYFDELMASAKIRELKAKGIDAYLAIQNSGTRDQSYAVRAGTFTQRGVAEKFAAKLSNQSQMEVRVVLVE